MGILSSSLSFNRTLILEGHIGDTGGVGEMSKILIRKNASKPYYIKVKGTLFRENEQS